jgi:hypothetical protein
MEEQEHQPANVQATPELLYHYTTQHGLLGILKHKCIWATHIRYLNDTSEGNIVPQVILLEFSSRYNTVPLFQMLGMATDKATGAVESVDEDALGQGTTMASWVTSQNVFVSSFSENGNSLSQWRAYSERSGGYGIGFRPEYLRVIGERFLSSRPDRFSQGSDSLVRCIYYDEEEERSLKDEIKNLVTAYIEEAAAAKVPVGEGIQGFRTPAALAIKHFLKLGRRSAITKDNGFREEAEWRLAFLLQQNSKITDIEFRPGSSMPVPYLKIPLRLEDQVIGIYEVMVGPARIRVRQLSPSKCYWKARAFEALESSPRKSLTAAGETRPAVD